MSQNVSICKAVVYEGSSCVLLGLMESLSGELTTQADMTSVVAEVFDGDELIGTITPEVADCLYDTAQIDGRSNRVGMATGYNFALVVDGQDNLPEGSKVYRVVVEFTETSGSAWKEVWDLRTLDLPEAGTD